MTQKPLVDIERVRAYEVLCREGRVRQNAHNARGLREEFITVFLNLVAELKSLAARRCGEIFAG